MTAVLQEAASNTNPLKATKMVPPAVVASKAVGAEPAKTGKENGAKTEGKGRGKGEGQRTRTRKPKADKDGSDGEKDAAPSRQRFFYMVRLPRPEPNAAADSEAMGLEASSQLKLERLEYLNAALRVKQVSKSNAQTLTNAALDGLKAASSEIRAKIEVLKPLQERLSSTQKEEGEVRALEKELPVSSEQALNDMVKQIEYRISHERVELAEEKLLVRKIKTLEMSRGAVAELTARRAAVAEARADKDELRAALKVMKEEVDLLRLQENMQREVFRKRQEEEKAIDADVKAILAERATVHTARDGLRDAIRSSRGASKKEETDYYKHRKQVRKLQAAVDRKDLEAAAAMAAEQVERIHARLSCDGAFRDEYLRLMRKQNPRRYAEAEAPGVEGGAEAAPEAEDAKPDAAAMEAAKAKAKAFIDSIMAAPTNVEKLADAAAALESTQPVTVLPPLRAAKAEKEAAVKAEAKQEEAKPKKVVPPEEANRGRKAADLPKEVLRLLEEGKSAGDDEDTSSLSRAKAEEAEERKRRLVAKAAKAKAAGEERSAEESRKKAERKKTAKQGGGGGVVEKEQVAVVAQHAEAAVVEEAADKKEAAKPAVRRKKGKGGKVVVESPWAAQRKQVERWGKIGGAVLVLLMALCWMLFF